MTDLPTVSLSEHPYETVWGLPNPRPTDNDATTKVSDIKVFLVKEGNCGIN